MDSMMMRHRRSGIDVQQSMGTRIFAVLTDEIQQLDVGLAALAQRGFSQCLR
jgi:hypothetical protein